MTPSLIVQIIHAYSTFTNVFERVNDEPDTVPLGIALRDDGGGAHRADRRRSSGRLGTAGHTGRAGADRRVVGRRNAGDRRRILGVRDLGRLELLAFAIGTIALLAILAGVWVAYERSRWRGDSDGPPYGTRRHVFVLLDLASIAVVLLLAFA